jgi:hypothetical protein
MARYPKRPWTAEEDQLLRKLAEDNTSTAVIVAKLKRTATAVRSRVKILKIPKKRRAKAAS